MLPRNSDGKSDREQITFSATAVDYRLASVLVSEKEVSEGPLAAPSNSISKAAGHKLTL